MLKFFTEGEITSEWSHFLLARIKWTFWANEGTQKCPRLDTPLTRTYHLSSPIIKIFSFRSSYFLANCLHVCITPLLFLQLRSDSVTGVFQHGIETKAFSVFPIILIAFVSFSRHGCLFWILTFVHLLAFRLLFLIRMISYTRFFATLCCNSGHRTAPTYFCIQ